MILSSMAVQSAMCAITLSPHATLFGHSIKNGPLPADTELTTFEHTCKVPPCVVTQLHVPSIYPPQGQPWNWQNGIIKIYTDGGESPSIVFTLGDLAALGSYGAIGASAPQDGSPYGIGLFGKTAKSGGVYSTVRIPFQRSIRTTIQAPPGAKGQSTYWFIVRGIEATPVTLGDMVLPAEASLSIHRATNITLSNLEFVTLAEVPAGRAGALLLTQFDAAAANYGYLEACLRAYIDGAPEPLFLSSGAEDYFLSASYFDEGMFKTPNSGLTFKDGKGTLSAYKVHDRDPVVWKDGLKLVWRNCETTSGCGNTSFCPNQWCSAAHGIATEYKQPASVAPKGDFVGESALYSTTVWMYTWPNATHNYEDTLPHKYVELRHKYDILLSRIEALEASTK